MGMTPSFVKDSKGFSQYLRLVHHGQDEELVSFDISALFTSIPVHTAWLIDKQSKSDKVAL